MSNIAAALYHAIERAVDDMDGDPPRYRFSVHCPNCLWTDEAPTIPWTHCDFCNCAVLEIRDHLNELPEDGHDG